MKKTTTPPMPVAKALCLSDYRLSPVMLPSEVCTVLEALKIRMGSHRFYPTANQVYFNLNQMKLGMLFCFQQHFKGEQCEVFMVVAFRYIIDHMDYEFLDDYSAIRQLNLTSLLELKHKKIRNKELQTNKEEL